MALPRLIFVTGKGSTGKSTIAAALALARQRKTSLADLDRRLSAMRLLGAPLDGAPSTHINETLEVFALAPRAELEAFIGRIVPIRAVARRMLKSRTFGFVTAALPGLEAFLVHVSVDGGESVGGPRLRGQHPHGLAAAADVEIEDRFDQRVGDPPRCIYVGPKRSVMQEALVSRRACAI